MDEEKARFMGAFAALDEAQQRRVLFLGLVMAQSVKTLDELLDDGDAAQQDAPTSPTA